MIMKLSKETLREIGKELALFKTQDTWFTVFEEKLKTYPEFKDQKIPTFLDIEDLLEWAVVLLFNHLGEEDKDRPEREQPSESST